MFFVCLLYLFSVRACVRACVCVCVCLILPRREPTDYGLITYTGF